jgi:hypothetical protein
MARVRTTVATLIAAPSSVAATTAVAVHMSLGDEVLAFRLAMPAGALTLAGLVVALSQETIRSWISHRAEQRRAVAEADAIRTLFHAATGGPDRTPEDAQQKRKDARAFAAAIGLTDIGRTGLGDAMQITRGDGPHGGASLLAPPADREVPGR